MKDLLVAAAMLALAMPAAQECLAQHARRDHAAGTGGGGGAGGGLILHGTFGQASAGIARSATHRASIGFWRSASGASSVAEVPVTGHGVRTTLAMDATPNPFTEGTDLRITAPVGVPIELTLHDALGRRVMIPIDVGAESGGVRTVHIDGKGLPSGYYTATLVAGSEQRVIPLRLVR